MIMKSVLSLFLGLLALAQGRILSSRIVNGEDVLPGEIPYQVSLQKNGYHFCGGSILNEYYVITAAHCVYGASRNVEVVVGTVSLKKATLKHKAVKTDFHEFYDSFVIKNDIALVKVETPFEFSEFVQPVPLPEPHFKVETNASATVSGWGNLLSSGGSTPDSLQKANIFIADLDYCRKVMKERDSQIFDTNVCANDPTMRRGQCNGDSGGPLTVDGKLTGIVSWSIKDPYCASTYYPGVYTRVSEYIDWINEHAV